MSIDQLTTHLSDRFADMRPLAHGGFGFLLRATERSTGRAVAIKVLASSLAGDAPLELKSRFLREARAIARLSHPYIVKVLEIGEDGPIPYFVMEMVEGETLGAYLRRLERVDIPRQLQIALDLCDGLIHAHQKGIIHRDLKPDNVVLLPQGGVKILDFGLAKVDDEVTYLTKTGAVMGTPGYMAPEQLLGEPADHRADIYSLGVLVYEMVTRHLPFPGDSYHMKAHQEVPLPTQKSGDVSPALEVALVRALAIKAADRYATVQDFKWDLAACLQEYLEFADIPLMGRSWKQLLQSDLERMAAQAPVVRETVTLQEGSVREVVLMDVVLTGLPDATVKMEMAGVGFVRDRTLSVLAQEIERYGGVLDRYRDDGVTVFFGSQNSSEDDASRAVSAGLEVVARARMVRWMLDSHGLGFETSVRLDIARVAVVKDERIDETLFALRRAGAAPVKPGVWVTRALARRLGERYIVAGPPVEPSPADPADPALVNIVGPGPQSGTDVRQKEAPLTAFVGRQVQLDRMVELWEELCPKSPVSASGRDDRSPFSTGRFLMRSTEGASATGRASRATLVYVKGEAGVGKSRLVHVFGRICKGPVHRASAASFPRSSYRLVSGLIRSIIGVTEASPVEEVHRCLQVTVARLWPLADDDAQALHVRALSHLLGVGDAQRGLACLSPAVMRDGITASVTQLLAQEAKATYAETARPRILVLEDLQWIDELSLQIVDTLLAGLRVPLLLVVTARPPWEPPERWKRYARTHVLDLGPLNVGESEELVRSLPGGEMVLISHGERLHALSGGNPLFLEETVQLLAGGSSRVPSSPPASPRDGTLTRKIRRLDVGQGARVPTTLQALVASRVDALPQRERELLQMAAVLGDEADGGVLEEMGRRFWGDVPSDFLTLLSRLEAHRFVEVRRDDGPTTYCFRQTTVREVVVSTMLACNCRILHDLASRSIEALQGTDPETAAVLAYHSARAGEFSRALAFTHEALDHASARWDHESMLRLSAEALNLAELDRPEPEDPTVRPAPTVQDLLLEFDLLSVQERAHEIRGERDQQREVLGHMYRLAQELEDDRRRASTLLRLSRYHCWHTADHSAAQEFALKGLELAHRSQDRLQEADALTNLANSHSLLGGVEEAIRHHRRAQRLYHEAGNAVGLAQSICFLAINVGETGRLDEAVELAGQALRIDQDAGDLRGTGRDLRTLGSLHRELGNATGALEHLSQALAGDRRIGYRQGQAHDLAYAGPALLHDGRFGEAVVRLEEALELARGARIRMLEIEIQLSLAVANMARGAEGMATARAAATEALASARALNLRAPEVHALALLARLHLDTGQIPEALALSERVATFARKGPLSGVSESQLWFHHGRILRAVGRSDESQAAIERARTLLRRRAEQIVDPVLRKSFLESNPDHRLVLGA